MAIDETLLDEEIEAEGEGQHVGQLTVLDTPEAQLALGILVDAIEAELPLDELEALAAAHGVELSDLLALLGTDDGRKAAAAARERAVQSGALVEQKARRVVSVGLDRVLAALRDPETSPATVTRLVEIASRLSGMSEERAARLRTDGFGAAAAPFLNLITVGADEVLPEPRPGEMRLTIVRPPGASPRREKVIEQEVTDVEAD